MYAPEGSVGMMHSNRAQFIRGPDNVHGLRINLLGDLHSKPWTGMGVIYLMRLKTSVQCEPPRGT